MKIITKKEKIMSVSDNWYRTYIKTSGESPYGEEKIVISKKLKELKNPTEKEITKIIGNNSWTSNYCDECNKDNYWLIRIGQEPDYDSSTACVCGECLIKASKLIKERW